MMKKSQGSYDHAYNGKEIVGKWKDNQVVTVASTTHGVAPLSTAGHYSKEEKESKCHCLEFFSRATKRWVALIKRIVMRQNTELLFAERNGGGPYSRD